MLSVALLAERMESSLRYNRASQAQSSSALKQRRSGYEPSDTETEWQESPWHDHDPKEEILAYEVPKNADGVTKKQLQKSYETQPKTGFKD